tara:strand:- start:273 stop:2144 length:1872 start_codon:yes stop_codon:yes gene_type:complete
MNTNETFGSWIANQILKEQKEIKTIVAIYPGRFQPMGTHHAQAFKSIPFKNKFIATSNKVTPPRSPFNFSEKKKIISAYGLGRNLKQVRDPYKAQEILSKYDPDTTAAVFVVGAKDASRLRGKFFRPWKGKAEVGYKDGAYTFIAPHVSMNVPGYGAMSGTTLRAALGDKKLDQKKKQLIYKGIFGHLKNYDWIVRKLEKLNEIKEVKLSVFSHKWWTQALSESLITEGGAYGHMSHPFDDKGLKFGDFKQIINNALQGHLDLESSATEKTDGQNLFITWNRGLKAARNVGDIKRGGMSAKGVKLKFANRGNIEKAFNYAMNDLSKAISGLSDKQKEKIFDGGNNWVNMEIMYPASANVVVYDAPYLQFHNVLQYKGGSAIGTVTDGARTLAGMISQINQNLQSNFSIIGPKVLKVKPHQDFGAKRPYFNGKLSRLMSQFGMKDSNTFGEYHQAWWENFVDKNIGAVDNKIKVGLVKRWAFFDKSFRLNKKFIEDEKILLKAKDFDKLNHAGQVKKNMFPFETLFFELGAEVLKNAEGFLAASPDKAVQNIRKQVAKAIGDVRKGGDLKKLNRMHAQLAKIQAIGGFNTIVPSEGLVFVYKGKTYKLTGAFAPVNQITGLMAF